MKNWIAFVFVAAVFSAGATAAEGEIEIAALKQQIAALSKKSRSPRSHSRRGTF